MDIQTSLIYGGIVIACAVVLFAISMFGIKEKTYDEAIAEQRLIPSEQLLLGRSGKDKSKEKKVKKAAAGKKVKEKPAVEHEKSNEKVVIPEVTNAHHEKSHVEFEPDAEVISEQPHQMENLGHLKTAAAPKGKTEKASIPKPEKVAAIAESFGSVKADKVEKAVAKGDKAGSGKSEKAVVAKADRSVASKVERAVAEEVIVPTAALTEEAVPFTQTNVVKEQRTGSRKKKSELAALQQMTGDREGVNVSLIVPLVQKAELSRSEIQILIDLLLNKQQNSAEFNSEWIEGRQDPMVKLKKQLSEKEKLLADEQEASQAFQNKLKELRTELNTDRSRWRQLEEALAAKQLELQHAATRLQHAQEAHKADKSNMQQQVQQLQAKVGEDHAIIRKLKEDQGQAQGVMQQEIHGQRQQLELHVTHVMEQHKEAEAVLSAQINQLHAQLQEQENVHVAVRAELQNTRENAIAIDNENKMLRDKMNQLNNEVLRQESISKDLTRQMEEMHHIKSSLDHRINSYNHLESQMQFEKDQLLKEVESLKEAFSKVSDVKSEASRLQAEKDQLLSSAKSLQSEAQHAREEKERLASRVTGLVQESQRLREENESLAAQVAAAVERPAADGRENGDVHYAEEKRKADEASQADVLLKQKETEVADLASQIINYKTEISRLSNECEAQRQKNNETSSAVRIEEQSAAKHLLERLFPEVKVADCKAHAAWVAQFETSARDVLSRSRQPVAVAAPDAGAQVADLEKQLAQSQAMVGNYKAIIHDTEALLKKLQEGAEEAEVELETVKEERDRLEQSLEEVLGAQEEKERLLAELASAQERDREMTKELTKLKNLVEIGPGGNLDLQHPVDKLNGDTANHSAAINGSETESSNAEGGSARK